jgi:hypothetical protein
MRATFRDALSSIGRMSLLVDLIGQLSNLSELLAELIEDFHLPMQGQS